MSSPDQPFSDRASAFWGTTACSSNKSQASRFKASSASSCAVRDL